VTWSHFQVQTYRAFRPWTQHQKRASVQNRIYFRFPEEEGIRKEEITNSDIVGRNHGESVYKNSRRRDEIFVRNLLNRLKRKVTGETKVKDALNKQRKGNGRGKNGGKDRGENIERNSDDSCEKHSLIRDN
jgi:hypothetical protein